MKITKKLNKGKVKLKQNINNGNIRKFINSIEGSDSSYGL